MQLNKELKKLREQQARDIQELEYLQHDNLRTDSSCKINVGKIETEGTSK